jgi:hypothetical protein
MSSEDNNGIRQDEGVFYKTGNFSNGEYKEPKEYAYIKDMEDNMKLFEMKLKKLEKNTFGEENNKHNYHAKSKSEEPYNILEHRVNPIAPREQPRTPEPFNHIDYDNLINELNHKNNQIAELNAKLEASKNDHLIEELHREIRIKDNECKKLYDDNERLKLLADSLKKENNGLKTNFVKLEKENGSLNAKVHELDRENKSLEYKVNHNEGHLKNLKFDYDSIFKNFSLLKKQYEMMTEKMDELKASNHSLLQEKVIDNRKPLVNTAYEFGNRFNIEDKAGVPSNKPVVNAKKTNYDVKVHTPNDIVEFPSEYKVKSNKNEMSYIEQRLSELGKEKVGIENNLFKLPVNPRTLNDINKKKQMETSLQEIEDKITELKLRLRQLNKK